jgi:hypothetical protein
MSKIGPLFQATLLSLVLNNGLAFAGQQFQPETPKPAKSVVPLQGGVNMNQVDGALSQYSGWGFFCARSKTDLPATVILVEPGTPAYQKGLVAGDKILKLDVTKTGIILTIERGSTMYAAELNNDQLTAGVRRKMLMGGARRPGLAGNAQQQQLQGDIWQRTLSRPLVINIDSGGGQFTNSFNGSSVRSLLMALADKFAQSLNSANLPAGATGIRVFIVKPHTPDTNIGNNGDTVAAFFSDVEVDKVGGSFSDPEKAKIDPTIDKKGLTLAPLDLITEVGGSHVIDSFNNGTALSIMDFTELSAYQSPAYATLKAGGALAEQPTVVLRPTIHEFSLPGSFMASSFDKDISGMDASRQADRQQLENYLEANPRSSLGQSPVNDGERNTRRMQSQARRELERSGTRIQGEHTCRLRVVPDRKIPGLTRPVVFKFGLGGSRFTKSFNHAGSITIMANAFLDRLSRQVKPSVLAGVDMLHFSHGGSYIENSFNQ